MDEAHITGWLSSLADRSRNFVTIADRGTVSHAVYMADNDPELELAVLVRRDNHDRGTGTKLCHHIVTGAADAGREAFVLHVAPDNQQAVHVYRELEFEAVSSDGVNVKTCLDLTSPIPPTVRPTTGTRSRE